MHELQIDFVTIRRFNLAIEMINFIIINLISKFELTIIFRIMINWHHSLISWHHSSNTLTLVNQIRKEYFVKQKSLHHLHARCTYNAQITSFQKKLRSLLSWSSAFEICKNDSKRATFDVIIKSEIRTFLNLFQKFKVLMFFASEH
jgi:hypothetical protein